MKRLALQNLFSRLAAIVLLGMGARAHAYAAVDTGRDSEPATQAENGEHPGQAVEESPLWRPQLLGAQYTWIRQHLYRFTAPYSGPLSLTPDADTQGTHTIGIYGGMAFSRYVQGYVDVEKFTGAGISNSTGLGGLTNGDVVRQGSFQLGKTFYLARAYLRFLVALGEETIPLTRAQDQLPGNEATSRLELKLGKLAANDDFDRNRYANSTRTQFQNWSLWNNTAWDYAADTRGYTKGAVLAYIRPEWAIRAGVYQMPEVANGPDLVNSFRTARGENVELTLQPRENGPVIRLLAYRNVAAMGNYRDAINAGIAEGTVPNVRADGREGRSKYGFGLNLEQPLADDGETGVFMRLGWNDGKTEDFCFTEVDRLASVGVQVSGARWKRAEDRLGFGLAVNGLSKDHREYLEAGGQGFLLGDGRLNYGTERILEIYYRIQLGKYVQLSPDFQHITNPGYNRDRGPANVVGLRLHLEY